MTDSVFSDGVFSDGVNMQDCNAFSYSDWMLTCLASDSSRQSTCSDLSLSSVNKRT